MKTKVAALLVASFLFAPMTLSATEPNPEVTKAIAEIAARREAKEKAAAQAAATARQGREGGWGGQPGATIQLGR